MKPAVGANWPPLPMFLQKGWRCDCSSVGVRSKNYSFEECSSSPAAQGDEWPNTILGINSSLQSFARVELVVATPCLNAHFWTFWHTKMMRANNEHDCYHTFYHLYLRNASKTLRFERLCLYSSGIDWIEQHSILIFRRPSSSNFSGYLLLVSSRQPMTVCGTI